MENTIKITLWGNVVGYLLWDKSNWKTETSVFKFDSSFLDKGLDISPIAMSIHDPRCLSGLPLRGGNPKDPFRGLPPVFADSLPDHWGNSLFRAWAMEHHISMKSVTPVDLLSFVGKRAMGALEYHPALIEYEDEENGINVQELYSFAKSVLDEKNNVSFSSDRELLWKDLVKLGTSPGGKRPKALIALNHTTGEVRSGQASLPKDFEYYILKYDNEKDSFPYARMEYVYWKLCRDAGIDITESKLKHFDESSHFITKRFDRTPNGKLHMQSLLAMKGDVTSYEEAFDTLATLKLDYKDTEQLFRRMVFNVAAGNIDDHARNFSFLMDKNGKWSLAPAYDMVYCIEPSLLEVQKGQFLSVCGKKNGIDRKDILSIGHRYNINRPEAIIDQVCDVLPKLHEYMIEEGIGEFVWNTVSKELQAKSLSKNGLVFQVPRPASDQKQGKPDGKKDAREFIDGWALVQAPNGKYNYVDTDGKFMAKTWFDSASKFKGGVAKCSIGNSSFTINREGIVIKKESLLRETDKKGMKI